jgi:hypothetical protein
MDGRDSLPTKSFSSLREHFVVGSCRSAVFGLGLRNLVRLRNGTERRGQPRQTQPTRESRGNDRGLRLVGAVHRAFQRHISWSVARLVLRDAGSSEQVTTRCSGTTPAESGLAWNGLVMFPRNATVIFSADFLDCRRILGSNQAANPMPFFRNSTDAAGFPGAPPQWPRTLRQTI